MARSAVKKRSISVRGHKTSVSIENEFWAALKELATRDRKSVEELIAEIEDARVESETANLSSAIRLYVLAEFKAQAEARSAPVGGTKTGDGKPN